MLLTIQKFNLIVLLVVLGVLYAIFTDYYYTQRDKMASVVIESLKDDMSELSYILSKSIDNKKALGSVRAVLDRSVSNNDFIATIMVLDDNRVLLTTDPYVREAPSKVDLYSQEQASVYDQLVEKKGVEGEIRFYEGEHLQTLQLLFLLDREELAVYFHENRTKSILYFGLLPILILLVTGMVLHAFLGRPLEKLRQFAYYQSEIPKGFKLKELEAIRSSMVQTFVRLDREKSELYRMARTDALSGLANRNALEEYMQRLIADAERNRREFAFIFLDLDHFKTVNDALGHNIGDELLQGVAAVIREVLRTNDFVARVGGDEFVIVLHQYQSLPELTGIIERIQKRLTATWVVQSHPINITSSVGIALYPKDGTDVVSLMQHSDIAMYEAKKAGRAQFHFFTKALNVKVQKVIALDKAMREALKRNEYQLYYQPKTDIRTGKIVGAEALIRWISPKDGLIMPSAFIPLAEENGFIVELGEWVLAEAMRQQKQWAQEGVDINISINVATKQLLTPNFEEMFLGLLETYEADSPRIDIEITEYLFLEQSRNNLAVLEMIRDRGMTISLDDFGTGYSSLSYLKKFPINNLKIDKVFADDYNTPEGAVFLETIVKMGQTLKMNIVAEGVESEEQLAYLKKIGCDVYQGFYCSEPLPAEAFSRFYRRHSA